MASSVDFSDYEIHGQIIGGNKLHPDIKVAGLLEMSKQKSNMQGMLEYQVNKFFKLGISAGMDDEWSPLGNFIITGDIPIGATSVDVLPFLKVTHQALGSIGVVVYWTLSGVVFNAGASYQPTINGLQKQKFSVMIGTGLR